MTQLKRIAFIGNSLPRRCGIATFTTDLYNAVQSSGTQTDACIVAMNDDRRVYDYPPDVKFQIRDDVLEDYTRAADFLNGQKYDVVSLQHEFGIFGGDAGAHVLALIGRLDMPVVTTFHTVLSRPTPAQHNVLRKIAQLSSIVVVMAEKARELLHTVYDVPAEKIEVVPHGIPDFPFVEPDLAKAKLGFTAKPVILTFGLLSPNKGIEVVIDAMPLILKSRPMPSMSSWGRHIPISCGRKARLIVKASWRVPKNWAYRTMSSFLTSSWTSRRCSILYPCATSM